MLKLIRYSWFISLKELKQERIERHLIPGRETNGVGIDGEPDGAEDDRVGLCRYENRHPESAGEHSGRAIEFKPEVVVFGNRHC